MKWEVSHAIDCMTALFVSKIHNNKILQVWPYAECIEDDCQPQQVLCLLLVNYLPC